MAGGGAGNVNFLETRNIHKARFGADGHIFGVRIGIIAPSRAHAAPVFQIGTECAVAITKRRKSPRIRHVFSPYTIIGQRQFESNMDGNQP